MKAIYFPSKKGVSPLVATVLLIAFTIALATIILSWLTNYTSTTTESTSATSAQLTDCSKAAVSIDAIYSNSNRNITRIDIRNSGLNQINVTKVLVSSAVTNCILSSADSSKLQVGDIRSYSNSTCQVSCDNYANTRATTECGSATAVQSSNATIFGCK